MGGRADGSARKVPRKGRRKGSHEGRWHRHGLMRPTVAGLLVLAICAGCCFLALLLDDRALSAATLALLVVTACSWIVVGVQRRMMGAPLARAVIESSTLPRTREGFIGYVPAHGWRRFVLPHSMTVAVQWERLDQHGDVVDRGSGAIPHKRGRYRHRALAATWSDPFGLVRQRLLIRDDGETLMLPAPDSGAHGGQSLAADARLQDQSANEGASGIREYAPGDSPRMISWRHTAHHGELMTRESDRDVQAMTLIVVDTAAASGTDLDAAAADVMRRLRALQGRGAPIAAGDGTRFHGDRLAIARFLAAMRPDAREGQETDPASMAGRTARFAAAQHHPLTVTLVTAETGGALERALRSTPVGAALVVRAVGHASGYAADHAPDRAARDDASPSLPVEPLPLPAAHRASGVSNGSNGSPTRDPSAERGAAALAPEPWHHPWRRHLRLARIVTVAALAVLYVCTLVALNPLVGVSGTWWPFLLAGLVVASAEAILLPPSTAWRSALRTLVGALAAALVAFALIVFAIHDAARTWPFGSVTSVVTDASGVETTVTRSNLRLFATAFEMGFDELYAQLPPVTVGRWSNVVLIALAAALIVLMRCLLTQPLAVPVVATIPVAVMGLAFAFVGAVPSFPLVGFTVLAALVLLWSVRPVRALAPLPLGASALATALVLALTPSAQSFAVSVPIAVGTPGGLFTTSTVNPLVDLKRGLNSGSSSIVFTYSSASGSPYYFRMATLDDFNGDTWRYDPQLATDGGLYGGHVNLLGRPQSDDTTETGQGRRLQGRLSVLGLMDDDAVRRASPYARTIRAVQLLGRSSSFSSGSQYYGGPYSDGSGYYGDYSSRATSRGTGIGTGSADGAGTSGTSSGTTGGLQISDLFQTYGMTSNTGVTIRTLGSRFLPLPGETLSLVGDVSGDGWYRADDGTVFSTGQLTRQDMDYTSVGVYLAPITSEDQFGRLDAIDQLREAATAELDSRVVTPQTQEEARRAYAEQGLGTVDGDWLIVPLHLETRTDYSGRAQYLVSDASGSAVSDQDYPLVSGGTMAIEFNDDFRNRLRIEDGELYAVGYGRDHTFTLALRLTGFDEYGADAADSDSGSASDEPTGTGDDLNGDGTEDTTVSADAARRRAARIEELARQRDELFDRRGVDTSDGVTIGAVRSDDTDWDAAAVKELKASDLTSTGTGLALRSRYGGLPSRLPEHVQAVIDQAKAEGVPTDGASEQSQTAAMRWLVRYFTQPDFVYSLSQPDGNGRNNLEVVDDFLVDRSGYCTHYATALAVLARGLGLSSRIVLGYGDNARLTGADSGSSSSGSQGSSGTDPGFGLSNGAMYNVMAKQLHSWTEVYVDNIGWVPFDVTPAADYTTASSGADDSSTASASASASDTASSSDSASASASSSNDASDEPTDESTDATEDSQAGTAVQRPGVTASWPDWAVVALRVAAALLACAAALLAPWGVRRRRRTRRLRLVDQAIAVGDDAALNRRAWTAAWAEMTDTARDAGVEWPATATDVQIGEAVETAAVTWNVEAPGSAPEREDVHAIAANAMAAAWGGPDAGPEPLDAAVPRALGLLRAHVTRARRLLPPSLFGHGRRRGRG
ncbi:transglutaminase-like enzyme, cysteine protease [Bifidobacterium sp. DSM 109958]|uniref:Transglutaminase-like enzyme, cysteine protease n=1 Tax=Bifidobacterium moraviense TaxID=2675323 RepID=A0A7Y0I055_9BIFI|nr:transglutaminaseTgpA domain-containing protein [Bifidobacterium sp. DSM 109958]NMN00940.1 transglutaminase-like enzyme, cysteine protease [Bifidobacterium sp. DSM 109958]